MLDRFLFRVTRLRFGVHVCIHGCVFYCFWSRCMFCIPCRTGATAEVCRGLLKALGNHCVVSDVEQQQTSAGQE